MLYVIVAPSPNGEVFVKTNRLIQNRLAASLYSSPSAAKVRFKRLFDLHPTLPWLAYEPWVEPLGKRVRITRSEMEPVK